MREEEFREIDFSATELEASKKINRYIGNRFRKYFKAGSKMWKFDLRTKKMDS